ncbi:MAG: ribose-5-phosphate isomerase [Streptosporangiales bacterium]|nr:ribose-5-phosphate isomerase [Streptosporangiales bacterium]
MRIYLGSDHAGYQLKDRLIGWLTARGHETVDCGAAAYNEDDDYPPYILRAALRAADDPGSFGVVLGGSGNGEAMAANKVKGARAALVWNEETARLAREHNDANVISLGARLHTAEEAIHLVAVFLDTPFSGAKRHRRRLAMLDRYEETGELPASPG